MADWDDDGAQLRQNLQCVLREVRAAARERHPIGVDDARRWQVEVMRNLDIPNPVYVGAFRGESGLENIQVRIGSHFGVPAEKVAAELANFQSTLRRAVERLDQRIPYGAQLDADALAAILTVCAWVHSEWVRIHPFANGNGRTARLWVNAIAMRYGLPPFLHLRPRPAHGYASACAQAMSGDWKPMVVVLQRHLREFEF